MEISRSRSAPGLRGRRSGESRHRESVRNLRNPYGSVSCAEATEAEAKNRVRGETGPYAKLDITTQTIGGVVGKKSMEAAAREMENNGSIEIPSPSYGYLSDPSAS